MCQQFRLKIIDETRNYFLKEIEQNELMSKKHNSKLYSTLSYFSFYSYWIYLNFYFCFFVWYSCRNIEFCNRIKNLCNNCKN